MDATIEHTAIRNRPVIEIITWVEPGPNQGRHYATSYGSNSRHETHVEEGRLYVQEFPLHRIIRDYIRHYGHETAIQILIGKGIINPNNKPIMIVSPDDDCDLLF